MLETIEEDIADQREKEALEEEEGKTAETRKPVITQPESFAFPPVNGAQTVYLWVRDSFGNVSDSSPLSITLAPLSLSWNAFYVDGMMVPAHEVFLLSAAEPLSADDASVSGAGSGTVTLSGTGNQSISVSPASFWSAGTQSVTLSVKTAYGLTAPVSRDFSIFNGVCVSSAGGGSDGTAREPISTIPAGITKADELYPGAGEVRISEGEYTTNWADNTNRITLIDGISLYGGYNPAWTARDVNGYPVVIRDESSGGGLDAVNANRAIDIPASITDSTTVDGVSVYGGGGKHSTAIFSAGSPKIENCKIYAGSTGGAGDYRYGFYAEEGSPEITGSAINIGDGGGFLVGYTFGIQTKSATSAVISGCKISGGTAANTSIGIGEIAFLIEKNEIDGGSAKNNICIRAIIGDTAVIRNNIIRTGSTKDNGIVIGLYTQTASLCEIRNNSFVLNATTGALDPKVYGIWSNNSSATTIENNLFICEEISNAFVYAVYNQDAGDLESMTNNGFSGLTNPAFTWLYSVNGGASYTENQLDDFNNLAFASGNVIGSANLAIDYQLTSTSYELFRTGGLDGAARSWGFSDDYSGKTRTGNGTDGWSIGCYEY